MTWNYRNGGQGMARKLYYSGGSPYARKIRILLHELELSFESDRLDGALRSIEDFGSIYPNITIPVLEDEGNLLFDSGVIGQYLLETYADKVLGTNSTPPLFNKYFREDSKWEDLKILATLETLTETMVSIFLFSRSMADADINPDAVEYMSRHRIRFDRILDWLDQSATAKGFIQGYFTVMDIQLISTVGFADARDIISWRGRPNLEAIVDYFEGRPSVASTLP
jgi:glutathione S-transferase